MRQRGIEKRLVQHGVLVIRLPLKLQSSLVNELLAQREQKAGGGLPARVGRPVNGAEFAGCRGRDAKADKSAANDGYYETAQDNFHEALFCDTQQSPPVPGFGP